MSTKTHHHTGGLDDTSVITGITTDTGTDITIDTDVRDSKTALTYWPCWKVENLPEEERTQFFGKGGLK